MADLWKVLIPAFSGMFGVAVAAFVQWWLSERTRKKWEIFSIKKTVYLKMLELSRGFYVGSYNRDQINLFVDMIKLLWLYAPDDVIKKTYAFTNAVNNLKDKTTDQEKHAAMEAFIFALRKDILKNKIPKKTKLVPNDFQHITAT